jgi:hypothetical protein
MRTRKEANKDSLMHLASAYKEDIFDGKGDKSRVPLAGRYATFDNVGNYILAAHLVGDETVVSVQGTVDIVNITISAGRIDVADTGKIWDLVLSDGTHYSFSEGSGNLLNNIGSNKNISAFSVCSLIANIDANSFWHTDGVLGEGSSYSNLIGYSTLSNGVGTGYYSSTFSKDYNSLGLTISGFIQLFSGGNTAAMGASSGILSMRSVGPATLEILMGGFTNNVSKVQVNTSLRQIRHYSFSIDALGNYQVFIEGILHSEGTLSSPNISFTNFQLYTRGNNTQRLTGSAAQIAYFEGVLNSDEHLELFQKACTNSIETHSRFNNCDIYVKGGDNGLATDYSNNNISFNPVGTNIDTAVVDLESLSYKQYQGQVHFPIKVKEHCLTSAGVPMKITMTDLTGVTITSSLGTSTPSIVGNDIELTAGSIYRLELSDGTILGLTEGQGTTVYDQSGNGNHGTISNPDLDCWDYFQTEYSNNHRGYNSPEVELYKLKEEWIIDALGTEFSNVVFDSPATNQFNIVRDGATDTYVAIDLNSLNLVHGETYTLSLYSTDYVGQPLVTVHTPQVYRTDTNNDTTWTVIGTGVSFTLGEANVYKEVTFTHDNVLGRYLIIGQVSGGGRKTNWIFEDVKISSSTNQISSPYAAKIPASLTNHHFDVLGNKLAAPVLNGKYMLPGLEMFFNYYNAPEIYKKSFGLIDGTTSLKTNEIVNQFPDIIGANLINKKANVEVIEQDFNPKNCPAILDYWFTSRAGITVDGSNFITSVENQGERTLLLDTLVGALSNFPIYNPTGFLGKPAFEFTGTNAIKGAASGESLDYTSSWFAVVFQDYFPAADNYLVDFQNIVRFMMRRTGSVRIQLSSGGTPELIPSDTNPHILIFTIDQNANGYILIDSLSEIPLTLSNAVTTFPNAAVSIGASTPGGAPCTGVMTDFMWGRGLLPLGWAKGLMTYLAKENNFTLI